MFRKKHDFPVVLKYMKQIKCGVSFYSIHHKYGINESQLYVLWEKYQRYGVSGLQKGNNIKTDSINRACH